MPVNRPAFLGMPDCECLQLLNMNCQTTNDSHQRRQINKPTKQDKTKPNNNIKKNPCPNDKPNWEINFLIARQGTKSDREVGAKHHKYMKNMAMYLLALDASKRLLPTG